MGTTIIQIKDMQVVVKQLLETYPTYRDNDRKLVAHVWMMQVGGYRNMAYINLHSFMQQWVADDEIVMPDTVTRARRKIQQEYPHLRGENYSKRHMEKIDVQNKINK
jgi:hypothetical protein